MHIGEGSGQSLNILLMLYILSQFPVFTVFITKFIHNQTNPQWQNIVSIKITPSDYKTLNFFPPRPDIWIVSSGRPLK